MVTKSFEFEDGIYLNLSELKNNQPGLDWSEVTATYFTNPISLNAEVENFKNKSTNTSLEMDKVFAFCKNGIPYINLNFVEKNGMNQFAGLQVRGSLGYYSIRKKEVEKIKIQAYNPLNGQPFRTGFVEKEKESTKEMIFKWEDGTTLDFNQKNMLELVAHDAPLLESIKELREWEIKEKLFKCLLIHNDRHSIFVPRRDL